MVRGLKIWIQVVEFLYYLHIENKVADQLLGDSVADLHDAKSRVSHNAANIFSISQFASQSQVRAYVLWRKSVLKWRQCDVEIDTTWRRYDVDIQISFTHLVPSCMHDSNSYIHFFPYSDKHI